MRRSRRLGGIWEGCKSESPGGCRIFSECPPPTSTLLLLRSPDMPCLFCARIFLASSLLRGTRLIMSSSTAALASIFWRCFTAARLRGAAPRSR
jgi:hypothetical protein